VRHHKWARLAKLVTGWAAHLFYWVYPGRHGRLHGHPGVVPGRPVRGSTSASCRRWSFCVLFRDRGRVQSPTAASTGSTMTAAPDQTSFNSSALVVFSVLAIAYRVINPGSRHVRTRECSVRRAAARHHERPVSVDRGDPDPGRLRVDHRVSRLKQKNPKRDIPRASLAGAGHSRACSPICSSTSRPTSPLADTLTSTAADGTVLTGMDRRGRLQRGPIGDMIRLVGDSLLGGNRLWPDES